MGSDVGEPLRQLVAQRANYRCEYCLLHQEDSYSPHQVDHIISRKHGGLSESDVGSVDTSTAQFVRFFHPRHERWDDHFLLRHAVIEPLTEQGKDKRVAERRLLIAGRYPR